MKKLLVISLLFLLSACGGGSSSSPASATAPATTPATGTTSPVPVPVVATVRSSTSQATVVLSNPVTITWSSTNATECSASGSWSGSLPASGSQSVTPTSAGTNNYAINCGGAKTIAHVNVLSQTTAIPDPTLQAALMSFGIAVTNGQINTADALNVTQLTISTLIDDCASGVVITNPQTQFCFKPPSTIVQNTAGLENFVNLDHLALDGQQFKSINLRALNKLAYLSLRQAPITTIDLSQNTQITTLGLGETSLTAVDLSALTALTELDIPNVQPVPYTAPNGTQVPGFDTLDMSKNVNLVSVSAEFNRITLLNTSHNLLLNSIAVFNNQITAIDFSKNTKLQYIWVNDNNLYYLNITGVNNGNVPSILMAFDNQDLWQIKTSQPAAMATFAVCAAMVNAVRIFVSKYEPWYAGNDSAISSYTIFVQGA